MKNVLLFMSDQHSAIMSGYAGGVARTPVLEEMVENGISFDSAYTSCPLCVPARMSFMSGRMPSRTRIMNNFAILPDSIPTLANAFNSAGYETVLIGRMHFVGENQYHGFQKRLVGDITSPEWKPDRARVQSARGPFAKCFAEPGCTSLVGGGNSPVLEYDEAVIEAAVSYLEEEHERPQFIIVGTYAPHFPYVGELDRYRYYLDKVELPKDFNDQPEHYDPAMKLRLERFRTTGERAIQARAAYAAMIEKTDENIGRVRSAFKAFNSRKGDEGLFVYTSDHGDMCGRLGLFGKMSFMDESARIPLLMEGDGIPRNIRRSDPVSLIDLMPVLCNYAGAEIPPGAEGLDFLAPDYDRNRSVVSELFGILGAPGKFPELDAMNSVSRMVRRGSYKLITRAQYEEYDLLFDLAADPGEEHNIIEERPEIAEELRRVLDDYPSNEDVKQMMKENWALYDYMQKGHVSSPQLKAHFWDKVSDQARALPQEK